MKTQHPTPTFHRQFVFRAHPGCPWADTMVLNPAIIEDPVTCRIHMLFRASGSGIPSIQPGQPRPFPICLGYAFSDDQGKTWTADWSRPVLAPALKMDQAQIKVTDIHGKTQRDHANGCIEDPRLFFMEGNCCLTVACRVFAPGPYWEHDEPMQCAPKWAHDASLGRAFCENVTVNLLYHVDLQALTDGHYDQAFELVTRLTNPEYGENRDVFLFPEKIRIDGHEQYLCLQRPWEAEHYTSENVPTKPSIFCTHADQLNALELQSQHTCLAQPIFDWEQNRIGASTPPIAIGNQQWLLCYHGKQDAQIGYTQSFMILTQQPKGVPTVTHRCSERFLIPTESWEAPGRFKTPCLFVTGMIPINGTHYLLSYGAADERVGTATVSQNNLIQYIKQFDEAGRWIQ